MTTPAFRYDRDFGPPPRASTAPAPSSATKLDHGLRLDGRFVPCDDLDAAAIDALIAKGAVVVKRPDPVAEAARANAARTPEAGDSYRMDGGLTLEAHGRMIARASEIRATRAAAEREAYRRARFDADVRANGGPAAAVELPPDLQARLDALDPHDERGVPDEFAAAERSRAAHVALGRRGAR